MIEISVSSIHEQMNEQAIINLDAQVHLVVHRATILINTHSFKIHVSTSGTVHSTPVVLFNNDQFLKGDRTTIHRFAKKARISAIEVTVSSECGIQWQKLNSEVQSSTVGDKNPRIFSLLNWAFCKLPVHSIESPTVADCRRQKS
uniref:Uncharacterized protein n=1 Tax=Romanomermis culicivorax TaxID=13658 RepID=A0A915HKV3_ROMCU